MGTGGKAPVDGADDLYLKVAAAQNIDYRDGLNLFEAVG